MTKREAFIKAMADGVAVRKKEWPEYNRVWWEGEKGYFLARFGDGCYIYMFSANDNADWEVYE